MIKFFEKDGRFNWVDSNNSFVGFSNIQKSYEDFGYKYVNENGDECEPPLANLFFSGKVIEEVKFEMDGDGVYYLILFNHHNGHYWHFYNFDIKEVYDDGYL